MAKVYIVQITWQGWWTRTENIEVSVGLQGEASLPNFATKIEIDADSKTTFVCDPPTLAQYVRIETEEKRLELCEVDVHATGNP